MGKLLRYPTEQTLPRGLSDLGASACLGAASLPSSSARVRAVDSITPLCGLQSPALWLVRFVESAGTLREVVVSDSATLWQNVANAQTVTALCQSADVADRTKSALMPYRMFKYLYAKPST